MTTLRLLVGPTPLDAAPRLAAAAGLNTLHVKRDDLTTVGLGGNKIRQIALIIADALADGADTLITTAGAQSNFCRALAGCAAKTSLRCHLLLRGSGEEPVVGNLLLMRLFGAEITFIPAVDPWSDAVVARLEHEAAEVRARGGRPYIVHLPGRTAARAAQAWVDGAGELDMQWRVAGIDPDALFVAAGSGLTAAGLILGLKAAGRRCRVHVISVQQPAPRLAAWIIDVARRTAGQMGLDVAVTDGDFSITDDQIGAGYTLPTEAGLAALSLAARTEALVLDPAYTGKAMAGLLKAAASGAVRDPVFLHSGGAPSLFAATEAVSHHLGRS